MKIRNFTSQPVEIVTSELGTVTFRPDSAGPARVLDLSEERVEKIEHIETDLGVCVATTYGRDAPLTAVGLPDPEPDHAILVDWEVQVLCPDRRDLLSVDRRADESCGSATRLVALYKKVK